MNSSREAGWPPHTTISVIWSCIGTRGSRCNVSVVMQDLQHDVARLQDCFPSMSFAAAVNDQVQLSHCSSSRGLVAGLPHWCLGAIAASWSRSGVNDDRAKRRGEDAVCPPPVGLWLLGHPRPDLKSRREGETTCKKIHVSTRVKYKIGRFSVTGITAICASTYARMTAQRTDQY